MALLRLTALALLLASGLAIALADVAEARVGGGKNFGSRGSRTYNAPPATNTAPKAAPIDKSMTQKGAPAMTQDARAGTATAAQSSRFGGWRGLVMGGLFVAALGSIFGFGALASVLSFVLQFALVAGLVYLLLSFFRNRNQPVPARGPAGRMQGDILNRPYSGSDGNAARPTPTLTIRQADLDAFERLLGEIQTAYAREDADELGAKTTPEMLSHFLQELSDRKKQGLRNEISGVKLLRGDLAEAWREKGSDYATVAMRYALTDITVDRATGRVVSGEPSHPTEATELWTFRRDDRAPGNGWQLSAIQQAA
jgi:predicted lipid-binding transport protein (Tim44 family)